LIRRFLLFFGLQVLLSWALSRLVLLLIQLLVLLLFQQSARFLSLLAAFKPLIPEKPIPSTFQSQ
jgi:hypothetical protein